MPFIAPVSINTVQQDLSLKLVDEAAAARVEVETFIHHVFAQAYGANVQHFLPRLMSLYQRDGAVVAALGMRQANTQRLFLENYLDTPVEAMLSQLQSSDVRRESIVEVGNLASVHRSGLRHLIIALTAYLSGAGTEWVVFTAIPAVSKAFDAMGLSLHPLAEADKTRLGEAQSQWGSYYDNEPMVFAGRVADGFERLHEAVNQESAFQLFWLLWQRAYAAGDRHRQLATTCLLPAAANEGLS